MITFVRLHWHKTTNAQEEIILSWITIITQHWVGNCFDPWPSFLDETLASLGNTTIATRPFLGWALCCAMICCLIESNCVAKGGISYFPPKNKIKYISILFLSFYYNWFTWQILENLENCTMNEKVRDLVSKIAQCMNSCTMNEKLEFNKSGLIEVGWVKLSWNGNFSG
jgi:hypothetical protein